jgi:hypothetical protein
MNAERREKMRAMGGPYRVNYTVVREDGSRREMPPIRNITRFDDALAHASRLSNLGYDVREPSLDTCG